MRLDANAPAHQVADKSVFKKRPVAGLVTKTVVGATLATVDAILTGKELESVKQHLSNKISSGIKEHFQVQKSIKESKGFEEFSQNTRVKEMKYCHQYSAVKRKLQAREINRYTIPSSALWLSMTIFYCLNSYAKLQ